MNDTTKKKLLIMASLFLPQKNSGGPPVSIQNLIDAIYNEYEVTVISKNHEIDSAAPLEGVRNGWNERYFGQAYYFPYGEHTIRNVLRVIEEAEPDIIYQNSFFSYDDLIPVLLYHKRHPQVRVIVTPRGEFQGNSYRNGHLKKACYVRLLKVSGMLKGLEWQFADSTEAQFGKTILPMQEASIYIIPNLSKGGQLAKDRHKEAGSLRLAYIGRIHPYKNLKYALDVLQDVRGEIDYDIYGSAEDPKYFTQCQKLMMKLLPDVRCTHYPAVTNAEVREIIGHYHALFIPSRSEAYGQSIVEALLAHVPVIISDRTPWQDVEAAGAGYALPLEKKSSFIASLQKFADMDNATFQRAAENAGKYIKTRLNDESCIAKYRMMFSGQIGVL